MTTAATSLLGLALPVTGELSGTWGDTVNNSITSLLDTAVAGTTTLSTDADVTLTTTTLASNQARQAIILWTASGTVTRNITAPAQSKIYTVINASGSTQSIVLRGAGPTTGVTILKGESAICAWNGSDFIKVSNTAGAGVFSSITNTGLTSGRVVYSTTGGLETDSANLTFNGTTLTANTLNLTNPLTTAYGGTGLTSFTAGDLPYYATGTALSKLGIGTNGQILTSNGSAPQWTSLSSVGVTTFSAGTTGFTPSSATSGAVTLAGTLATTNGGTGLTSFTANGVMYASSSSALATGSALTFDGTTTATPKIVTSATSGMAANWNAGSNDNQIFGQVTQSLNYFQYGVFTGGTAFLASGNNYPLTFYINGSEQMRLTSTGLGIGTSSPSYKLDVTGNGIQFTSGAGQKVRLTDNIVSLLNSTAVASGVLSFKRADGTQKAAIGSYYNVADEGDLEFIGPTGSTNMMLNSSGNLGLGVTPSAWSLGKAFEVGAGGNGLWTVGNSNIYLVSNTYYASSAYRYASTGLASAYEQENGVHKWRTAASGTAGNAISFTQAMTLDASGNLLVGGTSNAVGARAILENSAGNQIGLRYSSVATYYQSVDASGNYIITKDGSERARIDSSGNLLVGYTSGGDKLTVNGNINSKNTAIFYGDGADNSATVYSTAGPIKFLANASERARIDSSGNFCYGVSSFSAANNGFLVTADGSSTYTAHANGTPSGAVYSYFYYNNSIIGSISQSGTTAVLYNTTSDRRLKENIVDAESASSLIDSLQVRKFDWKTDGSHQRYGFIAQELVTVAPEAVHQPASPEEMMAVDYSKLVPMLVKEIQSLRQRLAAAGI